jgi:pimeloyl-ACP methyl ester carboxylesterase
VSHTASSIGGGADPALAAVRQVVAGRRWYWANVDARSGQIVDRLLSKLRLWARVTEDASIASAVTSRQRRSGLVNPRSVVALLSLLLAGMLMGCGSVAQANSTTSAASAALTRFYTQTLAWSRCAGIFQCTTLTVPLDYANPGGRTIQLAVIRALATDPAHRIGSLITNPGGPGGSGVQFVEQNYPAQPGQPSHFGPRLRADFDIVGFDPRGVDRSAPITCLSDAQLDRYFAVDPTPHTPPEINSVVTADKTFDAGCQAHSGALLPYVGTPNAARDMDILRAVLGDQKMYYLGASYGTYLGAIYAELFPTHIARAVLDGPVPPNLTTRQLDLGQAQGFQTELTRFISDCVTHPDCPLGTDATTAGQKLTDFLASTQTHPLPTGTGRMLDEALAETGVLVTLYDSPTSWPLLRTALTRAMSGNGHALLALSDVYNERNPNTGHYSNESEANVAINCLDHPDSIHSVADVEATLPAYRQASPLVGASFAWADLTCAYWPVAPRSQPHPVHYAGAAPILVLGTIHDPATPYPSAVLMADELRSGVLLTYNGDGHTAYHRGSSCINAAVDNYLTHGAIPSTGTVCQPDFPPAS